MEIINSDFQRNVDSLMHLLQAAVERKNFSYKNRECLVAIHPELTRDDLSEIIFKGIERVEFLKPSATKKRRASKEQQSLFINGGMFKEHPKTKNSGYLNEAYSFSLHFQKGNGLRLRMEIKSIAPELFEEVNLDESTSTEVRGLLQPEKDSSSDFCCCQIL